MNRGNNITLIGKLNRAEVYEYLFKNGDSSIQQIASDIGLSLPAVTRAIEVGLNQGLFAAKGLVGGDRGRKAMYYGLNPDCGHSISIYIKKDIVIVKIKDFTSKTISEEKINVYDRDIINLIDEIIEKNKKLDDKIMFIFVIVSGDVHKGIIVSCTAYKNLEDFNLRKHISNKFKMITVVENDMVAMVTSGFKYADNPDDEIIVGFLFGKDTYGAGVMINNVPYKGAAGRQMSLGELHDKKYSRQRLTYLAEKLRTIIVLLNPHTVVLSAEDDYVTYEDLIAKVKDGLPSELVPTFYIRKDFVEYCITGMIRLCIEEIKLKIRYSDDNFDFYNILFNAAEIE